jgi:hypothetical protein
LGWYWFFGVEFSLVNMAHGVARNVGTRKKEERAMEDRPSTSKNPLLSSQVAKEAWEVKKLFEGKVPIEVGEEVEELKKEVCVM